MKRTLTVITALLFLSVASCENETGNSNSPADGGSTIYSSSIVKDSNNEILGTLLAGTSTNIIFITSEDYVVTVGWNAEIFESTLVYKSDNCTGAAYFPFIVSDNKTIKNKLINNNNKFYEYANADENNLLDLGNVYVQELNSMHNGVYCDSVTANRKLVELKKTTKNDVGLPERMEAPIIIE